MAATGNTITATMGLNAQPLQQGFQQAKQHAREAGNEITKLFALEPLGVRRGTRAIERLAEGLTSASDASTGALESITAFGRSVSAGFAGGVVIGAVSSLVRRFVEAHEESDALSKSIEDIRRRSLTGGEFRTGEDIKSSIEEASKAIDGIDTKLRSMRGNPEGGAVSRFFQGQGNDIQAWLHGFLTPQGMQADLLGKRGEAIKAISDEIDNETKKLREAAQVDETRFRIGEREADDLKERIRHHEQLGVLAEQEKEIGVKNNSALREENTIDAQILTRQHEKQDSLQRQRNLVQEIADIQNEPASLQKDADLAQARLRAARAAVAAASGQGIEAQQAAGAQLTGAAGGVGDVATRQFEAGAAEFNMSSSQKAAQYAQRLEQYRKYQRYADASGIGRGMIPAPAFGAVEYDPLAGVRALQTARAKQGPSADLTLREQLKSGMFDTAGSQITPPDDAAMEAARQGMKLLNYPGLANTPYMDVPLVPPGDGGAATASRFAPGTLANKPDSPQNFADTVAKAITAVFREFWGQ